MGPWYSVSTVGALGQPGVGLGPPRPAVCTVTGHRDRGTTPWPQLCVLTSQDGHCQRLGVTTPDDLIWNGKTNHLETSPAMGQVWRKFNLERKPQRKTHLCVTSRNVSSPQLVWFLSDVSGTLLADSGSFWRGVPAELRSPTLETLQVNERPAISPPLCKLHSLTWPFPWARNDHGPSGYPKCGLTYVLDLKSMDKNKNTKKNPQLLPSIGKGYN